jgi:hypothetical protein
MIFTLQTSPGESVYTTIIARSSHGQKHQKSLPNLHFLHKFPVARHSVCTRKRNEHCCFRLEDFIITASIWLCNPIPRWATHFTREPGSGYDSVKTAIPLRFADTNADSRPQNFDLNHARRHSIIAIDVIQ